MKIYFLRMIFGDEIGTKTPQFRRGIRMEQFPINTTNARTIQKPSMKLIV